MQGALEFFQRGLGPMGPIPGGSASEPEMHGAFAALPRLDHLLLMRPMLSSDSGHVLVIERDADEPGRFDAQRLARIQGRIAEGQYQFAGSRPDGRGGYVTAGGSAIELPLNGEIMQIRRVAVARSLRRRGSGAALGRAALRFPATRRQTWAYVRESNLAACQTFRRAGFHSMLVRDYFQDPAEDGVMFGWRG